MPTTLPTSTPTVDPYLGMWISDLSHLQNISQIALATAALWVCGNKQTRVACTVVDAASGVIAADYVIPWSGLVDALHIEELNRVILSGQPEIRPDVITSDIATCAIDGNQLLCKAISFYDMYARAVTYIPHSQKMLMIGSYNSMASVSVIDVAFASTKSFVYVPKTMKSLELSHARSPPNYIGSFVAGTCVSSTDSSYSILAGTVRSDTGSLIAMCLSATTGIIANNAELVNALALEYTNPDSFITGGLQLSDHEGMHAYLLRVNSLVGVLKYCVRYRVVFDSNMGSVNTRRTQSASTTRYNSATKGIVRADAVLYMIIDLVRNGDTNGTSLIVVNTDMNTGIVLHQVHVYSPSASIFCTDITASSTRLMLYIACSVQRSKPNVESVIIAVSNDLSFLKLPTGFYSSAEVTVEAERIPLKATKLDVSVQTAHSLTTNYEYSSVGETDTFQPSLVPTLMPSALPSSTPFGQPSSSPSAGPSISPQPTSHPSSSGPTNTYKPTVKPTQHPSALPSMDPTASPTLHPSIAPTTRPSTVPSAFPSTQPTVLLSKAPTRAPSYRLSIWPSTSNVYISPTRMPTAAPFNSGNTVDGVERRDSDVALVIGGSVIGGLMGLWFVAWLIKWSIQKIALQEKKNALRETLLRAAEPPKHNPPPIVNMRTGEVNYGAYINDPSENDIENPPVGAYATGVPLPVDRPASVRKYEYGDNAKQNHLHCATSRAETAAENTSFYASASNPIIDDDSSVVLSSLSSSSSSEMRGESLHNNNNQPLQLQSQSSLQSGNSSSNSKLSCSESTDSGSIRDCSEDSDRDSDIYSLPSAVTDGAD